MQQAKNYLRRLFGTSVIFEENYSSSSLPMYLTENYRLLKISLDGEAYILVKPEAEIRLSANIIKKQLAQILKHTLVKPILVVEKLRLSQRNALIQAGIAFIVPNTQIYIPKMVIELYEKEAQITELKENFSVCAQVVYIYLLINRIIETNAHKLCSKLKYSVAAVNRALKELSERKLLTVSGASTRKKYIIADMKKYWDEGKQYLFDPVKAQMYVKTEFDYHKFRMSNELALTRLSFLGGGNECYYALSIKAYNEVDKNLILNRFDVFDSDYVILEKFAYDPKLLSDSMYIDVVSLYAQFKNNRDERIQEETESLIKELL